jgi:hypothetical protein
MTKKTSCSLIEDQLHAKKIGRLSQPIAKAIRRKSADIYITENYLKHIFIKHEIQLAAIGFTPKMFLEVVIKEYNRIYRGTGNSLLLTKWNGTPKIAAIELNLAFKEGFYEVKTAFIREKRRFKNEDLLWKKK